jgi:hypothetical protein
MLANDAVGILVTVLMFVVTLLLGMITWVFLDFRRTITKQVTINGKHLDSIMTQLWLLIYRMDSVEDFLSGTTEYRPVRVPPQRIPPRRDDT